jgi:uncharacterized protein YbcI
VLYDQPLGELTRAISNEAVRLIADYTGRGPTKVRTTVNGDWVFITLQDTLTKGEQRLASNGHGQTVLSTRKSYQHVMREELEATVTRHLGRKVIAFLSDNHIEPDVAIEAFLLEQESSASTATPIK